MVLNEKWFRVRKDKIRLPNGKIIDDYFVWDSPDVCTVVPITTDEKFILVKQYKHAAGKIVTEFPAGVIESKSSPRKTARRELEEETGYIAKKLKFLGKFELDPTKRVGKLYIYLAEKAAPTGHQKFDETEEIEVLAKSYKEVTKLIFKGKITDPSSIAAFFLLTKKYPKLVKKATRHIIALNCNAGIAT